jgi:hypothetical protein
MQKGFTNIRPVRIFGGDTKPEDVRQVIIFNNSGVSIWLGDDENSATSVNGVPVIPGSLFTSLWVGELWVGADVNSTEFRYMISPHFQGSSNGAQGGSGSWEDLGRRTPQPTPYFNRPVGR